MEAADVFVFVNDVGAQLITSVWYQDENGEEQPLDISDASTLQLIAIRGNGMTEKWDCSFYTDDGCCNQMSYVFMEGVLPIAENLIMVPRIEWPDGTHFSGSRIAAHVLDP